MKNRFLEFLPYKVATIFAILNGLNAIMTVIGELPSPISIINLSNKSNQASAAQFTQQQVPHHHLCSHLTIAFVPILQPVH
jgi:hypothetical protein